jgi:predicted phosphodiesterase
MEERAKECAVKPLKITKDVNEDLMLEIPMADVHMGALAWDKETRGDNYDVKIAKEVVVAGFGSILSDVPKVGKIVIVTLGDFYHADNKEGTTSRSGNILDTDSRFAKRVDYGINALKECIELASTRAKNVEVIVIAGNHDDHSSTWLPRVLAGHYIQNPQINISTDVAFRQYVEHGKVMLAYMHGHEMKSQRLVNLIPAEQPEMWGRTKYRYARLGHWHHRQIEEFQGITVETIPTVAAPDSYAAQHGFMSRRAMVGYLYHGEFGLRSKFERSIEEIKSYAKKMKK